MYKKFPFTNLSAKVTRAEETPNSPSSVVHDPSYTQSNIQSRAHKNEDRISHQY